MLTTGNSILITGGGSVIGRALAEAFHERGNAVVIAGRRKNALKAVAAAHPGMRWVGLDITKPSSIYRTAEDLQADVPALNVLIHNAGIMTREQLWDGEPGIAEATVATNLLGPIRLTAALLPHLLIQPRAATITVSAGLAFVPLALNPTYCATKAAIRSYAQSMRYQLKDTPVQIIELVPPYVQTELQGADQATDSLAMPLKDYIAETMEILTDSSDATEVLVEGVKPQRLAEVSGGYEAFFTRFNDALTKARARSYC